MLMFKRAILDRSAVVCLLALTACAGSVSKVPCTSDASCPTAAFCDVPAGACAPLPPNAAVSVDAPKPVTAGKSLKLTAHASGGVSWSVQEQGGGTVDSDGTYHAPQAAGTFHVIATSTADSSKSATQAVVVAPVPQTPTVIAPALSSNGKAGLVATVADQAGMTFSWTLAGGTITSAATGSSVTFTAGAGAAATLTVTATNAANDSSAPASLDVRLVPAPDATIAAPAFVTMNKAGYTASVRAQANSSYAWTLDGGSILSGQGSSSIAFMAGTVATATLHVHVVNAANDAADASFAVSEVPLPSAPQVSTTAVSIPSFGLGVKQGQSSTAQVVQPVSGLAYVWTINGGTYANASATASGASVQFFAGAAGPMTLTCAARNAAGDSAATSVQVLSVGPPQKSSTSADVFQVVADGMSVATITVTLMDAAGTPAFADAVTFVSNNPADVFNGTSPGSFAGTTDNTGTIKVTMSSTKAEAKQVNASSAAGVGTAALLYVAGAPSPLYSTLGATPASVVADGVATVALSAAVFDQFRNPVASTPVGFTADGAANSFSPASTSTGAGGTVGVASSKLASTKAQTEKVTAAIGPAGAPLFTLGPQTVAFTIGDPSAATSTFVSAPSSPVANGAAATIRLLVTDAGGNAVANLANVQVSVGGSANTLGLAAGWSASLSGNVVTGTTDAAGTLGFTLATTKAEAKPMTATMPKTSAPGTVQLGPVAGATFVADVPVAANSTIGTSAASVIADNTSSATLTVQLQDVNHNPCGAVPVQFQLSSGTGTFTPASTATSSAGASLGAATSALTSFVAESKSVKASVGPAASPFFTLSLATAIAFTPGDPDPVKSTFSFSPSTGLVADNAHPAAITLTVRDAGGNLIKNLANVAVTASGSSNNWISNGGPTVSSAGFTGATDASGTLGGFSLETTKAEPKVLSASMPRTVTTGANIVATSPAVVFVGGPAAPQSTLVGSSTPVTADGVSQASLTLTLVDSYGNPAGPGNTFSLSSTSGSRDSIALPTLTSPGVYAISITSTLASATDKVTAAVTPSNGGAAFSVSGTVDFVAGPAQASNSTFTATGSPASTDAGSSIAFAVQVDDAKLNGVPGLKVAVSASGSGNTFSPAAATTFGATGPAGVTDGTGRFSFTMSSTKAEQKSLSATVSDSNGNFLFTLPSLTVSFTAGTPSATTSTFTAVPTTAAPVYGDGSQSFTLQVKVKDANGNPVNGQTVSFTASGQHNGFGATSGTTVNGGFSTALSSYFPAGQTETITAAFGAASTLSQQVTFTALPWQSGSGVYGGGTTSIAIDPSNSSILYAGTDRGVVKSTDGGASWAPINSGIEKLQVTAVAATTVNAATVLFASSHSDLNNPGFTGTTVYRSTDGGATWTGIKVVNQQGGPIVVYPGSPLKLTTGNELSLDGGNTWTAATYANSYSAPVAIAFEKTTSVLYLIANSTLLKSTDGGNSWTDLKPVQPNTTQSLCNVNDWQGLAVDNAFTPSYVYVACGSNLWKSNDGGSTWISLAGAAQSQHSISVGPPLSGSTANTLYVGSNYGGLFRSTDNATTWTTVIPEYQTYGRISAVLADPAKPTQLYAAWQVSSSQAGVSAGAWRTDATGAWVSSARGLTTATVDMVAADPSNATTVYAFSNGPLKSTDSGLTFSPAGTGLPSNNDPASLSVDASGNVFALANSNVYELAGGSVTGTWKSPSTSYFWYVQADPTATNVLYSANGNGFSKSTNGGTSWTAATAPTSLSNIGNISVCKSFPSVVYAEAGTYDQASGVTTFHVWLSTNSGASWSAVYNGPSSSYASEVNFVECDPTSVDGKTAYAATNGGVLKTTDGGTTWSSLGNMPSAYWLGIDPVTPSILWAAFGNGLSLQKSTDGGATWHSPGLGFASNADLNNGQALALGFKNSGTVYVGTWNSGVMRTTTGGQ